MIMCSLCTHFLIFLTLWTSTRLDMGSCTSSTQELVRWKPVSDIGIGVTYEKE